MDAVRSALANAASLLSGRTVALVYAHSFDEQVLSSYYLRQRTEVLSGYADVIDLLGAYPVFYNIDQFVEACSRPEQLKKIDYIVNVPGGSLNLDLITVVSTLAGKSGKPIFPASATSIGIGQNKPVARRLARDLGWLVPKAVSFGEAAKHNATMILKPKYAGDSYGIRIIAPFSRPDEREDFYMLEEFVRGYDLTTYIIYSIITKRHEVLSSSITIPSNPNDINWYWDNASKFKSSGRGHQRFEPLAMTRERCRTSSAFDQLCCQTCEVFGVYSLARIDFRLQKEAGAPVHADISECRFLEINVLPSITPSGSWDQHIARHIEGHGLSKDDVHPLMSSLPPMQAAMLYLLLSWIVQRGSGSATGVDQLK